MVKNLSLVNFSAELSKFARFQMLLIAGARLKIETVCFSHCGRRIDEIHQVREYPGWTIDQQDG